MAATASQHPRYEAHEKPPFLVALGYGLQFSLIASATLLVTPVIVAQASGRGDSYLVWMVFASLLVVGVSTLLQVRRLGTVGAGAVLPMFTAAFSIPFCITAVVDGGPATLTTLVLVTAVTQLAISKWLFILRRIVTPTVGGTVMMILSITLASVVFGLLDRAAEVEPVAAPLTALATLVVVAALTLRGSAVLRLWGPVVGIVVGCVVATALGIYDIEPMLRAPWVGLPSEWPGLGLDFGLPFWTLLPAFLFLGVIISIQTNGAAIAMQRVSWRQDRAVDFREVQGALAGAGVTNLLASITGAVPTSSIRASFRSRRSPASLHAESDTASAACSSRWRFCPRCPGYLILVTGTLFVDGAQTVIQTEQNKEKVVVAGMCFWIGAAFQFGLFDLPNLGPVWGTLLKSGVTTGGLAAIIMILYLEFTNPRRMRFQSQLHIDALPDLNEFIAKFATRRGWDTAMQERLSAVAEETL